MLTSRPFPSDFFLSRSPKDGSVVRPIAKRLQADGCACGSVGGKSPHRASRTLSMLEDQMQEDAYE